MSQHPNARLTPRGRETLVSRIGSGAGVAETARQMGVSRQTTSKRLARARRGEPMSDRPSRPRALARRTPPEAEARVLEARHSMLLAPLALAAATGVPARTCARIVARSGPPRLADVDRVTGEVRRRGPATPVRYERERPGELVHVDVKKVARIPDGGGWRALGRGGDPSKGHSGAGSSCLHVAVDDFSRGRLRRAAARRAQGHVLGVHGPVRRLLRRPRGPGRARDDRQRPRLPQPRVQGPARIPGDPPCLHEAVQPLAERQGRAHEPHARAGVAVRAGVGQRGREGGRPPGLHRPL